MVRLAAPLVAEGGILLAASCSHHADLQSFAEQVRRGLADAGREGRILRTSGAAPDHPVHPALPESAYLKAQILALDCALACLVSRLCRGLAQWQHQAEQRAFRARALQPDVAAVSTHDVLFAGQPQAGRSEGHTAGLQSRM